VSGSESIFSTLYSSHANSLTSSAASRHVSVYPPVTTYLWGLAPPPGPCPDLATRGERGGGPGAALPQPQNRHIPFHPVTWPASIRLQSTSHTGRLGVLPSGQHSGSQPPPTPPRALPRELPTTSLVGTRPGCPIQSTDSPDQKFLPALRLYPHPFLLALFLSEILSLRPTGT
jgi:hypothetical protein